MEFSEKHHAFISAIYYKLLKGGEYKKYKNTFMIATRKAAEERGTRMALRAIRDGVEDLDYAAYRHYGEWIFTQEYLDSIEGEKHIIPIERSNDFAYVVYNCPWAEVYHKLDLNNDGGILYCKDLDASIVRGFNPKLGFELAETLQDSTKCVQYQIDGNLPSKNQFGDRSLNNTKGFDYQCGHIYNIFSRIMVSVYDSEGVVLNSRVIDTFRKEFGNDMADKVLSYCDTDFLMI